MEITKVEDDYTQIKRVTFEDKEKRLFAITRDLCKKRAELEDADEIDFEPYCEDDFSDDEKQEIRQMLEDGVFEDYLEW